MDRLRSGLRRSREEKEVRVKEKKVWQRKPVIKAMYRWSLPIMVLVSLAIFGVYILLGYADRMMADPFHYLADILVRSLVAPLIVIPSLMVYYRDRFGMGGYFNGKHWGDDEVMPFAGLMVAVGFVIGLACYLCGDWNAVIFIGPIVFFGIVGIMCALLAESLPLLVIFELIGCFLYLALGSYSALLNCFYIVASGLVTFCLFQYLAQFANDFGDSSKENSLAQRMQRWFLPDEEEERS